MKTIRKQLFALLTSLSMCFTCSPNVYAQEEVGEQVQEETIEQTREDLINRMTSIHVETKDVTNISLNCTNLDGMDSYVLLVEHNENVMELKEYLIKENTIVFSSDFEEGEYQVKALKCIFEQEELEVDLTSLDNREFTITKQEETVSKEEILEEEIVMEEEAENQKETKEIPSVLSAPILLSVKNNNTGLIVKWDKVENAIQYSLWRKENDGGWLEIRSNLTGSSYTDTSTVSGIRYTYALKSYNGTWSDLGNEKSLLRLDTPDLSAVTNTKEGVKIKWDSVGGAKIYRVYRKEGSTYKKIADVSTTSYVDTDVSSGNTYTYTVKAGKDSQWSNCITAGISSLYLATPSITTIENKTGGLNVKWTPVEGATYYRLYKKVDGKWSLVIKTEDTSEIDTHSNVSGESYCYTVRAVSNLYMSDYEKDGTCCIRLCDPQLNSIVLKNNTLTVSWKEVTGANSYNLYRKKDGGKYSLYKKNLISTSYTDSSITQGVVYVYTVRAVNSQGLSYFSSAGKKGIWLAAPTIKVVSNTGDIKLSWNSVAGASGYNVYRKESGKSYAKITTITNTAFTDTTAKINVTYDYVVKACYGSCESASSNTIQTILKLGKVTLKSISKSGTNVIFKWNSVANAKKYRVYRKENGGSWKRIDEVSTTSYTDSNIRFGIKYTYTVRAMNGSLLSEKYDTKGLSVQFSSSEFERTYNQLFYVDNLLIANKKHSLPANYAPGEDPQAGLMIRVLINDMRAQGYNISTSYSGYRSYETQSNLYWNYVASYGQAAADTFSARPGYSEHQTGLAFDLLNTWGSLVESPNEVNWIAQNAYKYGFIVRYTSQKEPITGYIAEPWHLRFVGSSDLAKQIKDSGLCLEEFLGVSGGDY